MLKIRFFFYRDQLKLYPLILFNRVYLFSNHFFFVPRLFLCMLLYCKCSFSLKPNMFWVFILYCTYTYYYTHLQTYTPALSVRPSVISHMHGDFRCYCYHEYHYRLFNIQTSFSNVSGHIVSISFTTLFSHH